ncbi:MAG: cation:proton antiporter, partial [Sporomusaceae bacterium]|nr:cation:proton antiporter [Sporomusaceae bacterium]
RSNNMFANFSKLLVLPVIIGTYFSAEHFGASGFMAVFVAGLLWGNNEELGWAIKKIHRKEVTSFIHIISTIFTIAIFVLLGSHIEFSLLTKHLFSGLAIVGIFMFVARPIAVLAFALADQKANWQKNEMIFMMWTRETGVIPAALIGMLTSYHLESLETISSVVILTILITLILQPATTKLLAKRLNLLIQKKETGK